MADRKEYELLFALNARMNGGFSGTFSKAQTEFTRLGKEIQDLHKLQGDIASYQKQQGAIENTRSKLENLQKQHGLLQREIEETNGSTAGLERESVKLEQRIKDTETALERQNQKLETTGARLREAGADTLNLAQKNAELASRIKELRAEQDKAADSAGTFGERTAQAFDAAGQAVAAAGISAAVKELAGAFVECVGAAGGFEEAMSTVEALSQANARDMAALAEEAKDLGATTKFTAQEAGDAMGYMAMAGWDANDMLQGMDGVLQLAAASGEDLAMVSDIVTDSLSAFGLTAKDTAHFSDVLAAAATSSNTNVAIMGETFKTSASVAGALGYSIEDVAVAMGLMANSGVKGSIAGTALRNTFDGLLEGVTLTGAAFGEYEYSAIKADGAMKDFGATIDELRGYFEQMTEAERVANAQAIAGQRGYNGLLAILNATDADYASLTNSINNCTGAAQRMAAVRLDNLNGQLTLMDSAWDALKTTIGEQFNPELRELAETGTDVLGWVNEFVKEHPALIKGAITFVGVAGAAAGAIVSINAAIKVFQALNLAALFTGPAGALIGLGIAAAAVTAAVVGLNEAAKDQLDESWELTAASREQYTRLQELNTEYEHAAELYGETSYEAQSLKWQIEDLTAEYENGRQTFEEYKAAHEAVMESYRSAASDRNTAIGSLETETAGTEALIRELEELTTTSARAAENQDAIRAIVDHLNEALPDLSLSYEDVVSGSGNFIDSLMEMAAAEAEAKRMAQGYENYVDAISQRGILEREKAGAEEQVRIARTELEAAQRAYEDLAAQVTDPLSQAGSRALNEAIAPMNAARSQLEYYTAVLEETTAAYEENEAALAGLESTFQAYHAAQEEAANAAPTLEEAISSVRSQVEQLSAAYYDAYAAAEESISGQYSLWDEAESVVATSASSINAALESQISYWEDYNANLESLSERSTDIAGLSDLIATFADGSQDSVNAIAGMASASDEDLRIMVARWQELQEQQSVTSQSLAELVTDFPSQMEELVSAMEEGVEGMSMPDEAKESARATIQAFIDEADALLPVVQEAYARLGQAAMDSLGLDRRTTNSSRGMGLGNAEAFASGTESAPPGWAWVGEEGPELIRMRGGETVLPADVSRGFALAAEAAVPSTGGASAPMSVEMHFHIDGGASPEAVEALRSYVDSGSFEERVMDVVARASADARRRDGF